MYLAKRKNSNETVAIKDMIIARQPRLDMIINEINVMKEVSHPNIVNFLECYLVKESLWVVMEYMEGGMLTDIIDKHKFTEPQISVICLEVKWYGCSLIVVDFKRAESFTLEKYHS